MAAPSFFVSELVPPDLSFKVARSLGSVPTPLFAPPVAHGFAGRYCRRANRWKRKFSMMATVGGAPCVGQFSYPAPTWQNTVKLVLGGYTGGKRTKATGRNGIKRTNKGG